MKEMGIPVDVREGNTIMTAECCMNQLMKQKSTVTSLLPLLIKIVETALTMPISCAWPERGASQVRLIKTRLRSTMTSEMGLLNTSINGPEVNSPDCDALIKGGVSRLSRMLIRVFSS